MIVDCEALYEIVRMHTGTEFRPITLNNALIHKMHKEAQRLEEFLAPLRDKKIAVDIEPPR
jgi:hypothetical protein